MSEEVLGMPEQFSQQEPEQVEQVQPESQLESKLEGNLRDMRKAKEAADRRAEESEQRIRELERFARENMNQQQGSKNQVEEDDTDINDDSYVEGKQLKKQLKNIKNDLAATKRQLEETSARNAEIAAEAKLTSEFNDFNKVVTKENIARLADEKPALYRSIMANSNLYDKGYAAYEFIKSLKHQEDYQEIDRKLEENRSKPKSASTVGSQQNESVLAQVTHYGSRTLSEDRKKQLQREMRDFASRR